METLNTIYHNLLDKVSINFIRYLYKEINWDARLIAITGARGTGKTTLLLQRIKLSNTTKDSLYVSADNIYFSNNSIYELTNTFYKYGGKYLYIDEIHKYSNWSQEIKNIYDSFPDLKIVFTGSSILDIYKGFGDLSRRVVSYELRGLSFREFLIFETGKQYSLAHLHDIVKLKVDFSIDKPLKYFSNYLKQGYYPFYKEEDFQQKLYGAVNAVLEVDIPKYLDLRVATIEKLKQLMQIISESAPFKPNITKLAEMLGISRILLPNYFSYLERAGLIIQLKNQTKGVRALGKIQKVYLNNTNLMYMFASDNTNKGNLRETFFINQLAINHNCTLPTKGDFFIDDFVFEVGGKNKTKQQIKNIRNAFVVKDDIEHGFSNIIPLWHFGMMY